MRDTLKANSVSLVAYVPDNVLKVGRALTEDGPWLIALRIDDKPGVGATERDPVLITDRFMRGLGTKG